MNYYFFVSITFPPKRCGKGNKIPLLSHIFDDFFANKMNNFCL